MTTHTENTYITVSICEHSGLINRPSLVEAKVIKVDDQNTYVAIPGAVASIEMIDLGNGLVINQAVQIRTLDIYELDILQWGIEVDAMLHIIAQNLETYEYHETALAA